MKNFEDLVNDNNNIVAIAMFKPEVDEKGNTVENSFILTAYQKYIKQKGWLLWKFPQVISMMKKVIFFMSPFLPGEKGTGVELNDNVLLRLDKDKKGL